jgi:predicted metallo-beta-lactamase superfamily hydrolase
MLGYRFSKASLEKAVENLKKISEVSKEIVLDHHLLRDINWRKQISELFVHAEQFSTEIKSAAEFRGVEENLLEARRKELYERFKF